MLGRDCQGLTGGGVTSEQRLERKDNEPEDCEEGEHRDRGYQGSRGSGQKTVLATPRKVLPCCIAHEYTAGISFLKPLIKALAPRKREVMGRGVEREALKREEREKERRGRRERREGKGWRKELVRKGRKEMGVKKILARVH